MSFLTKLFLWAGAGVLAGYLVIRWFAPELLQPQPDPRSEEYLSQVAAEINRSVPTMVDPETELMPAVGAEGMLTYNYRLPSYNVAQFDLGKFTAGAKQRVTQGACSRPETRDGFLKKGVTLRYSYYDKERKHIATVDVQPSDCGF